MSQKQAKRRRQAERRATGTCELDRKRQAERERYDELARRRQAAEDLRRDNPDEHFRQQRERIRRLYAVNETLAAIGVALFR
ncbi:MAG TPA: hypothetical protein VKB47_08680 [Terracidiphilus sp.]|nr:hypothetical protein [Terracidiphilus sp.]